MPVYPEVVHHFQDEDSLETIVDILSSPTKRFHRPTGFLPEQLDLFLLRWFQEQNLLTVKNVETLQSKKNAYHLSEIRNNLFRLVEMHLIEIKANIAASGRLYRLYAFPGRVDKVGSEH